jgi:hypothetical protein
LANVLFFFLFIWFLSQHLIHLENKGIEIGYFELNKIKNIETTCCSVAETEVIDFDKTKDKLVASGGLVTTKSCDCIKIRPTKQCIDLIEMKRFVPLVENFKKKRIDLEVNKKIAKFNFTKKIEDSLVLLDILVRKMEFEKTLEDDVFFRETKINYIVLTDVDSIHESFNYIALNFIFYAEYSDSMENYIASEISKELTKIPNINHKLNSPMLKTCNEIDDYYLENR